MDETREAMRSGDERGQVHGELSLCMDRLSVDVRMLTMDSTLPRRRGSMYISGRTRATTKRRELARRGRGGEKGHERWLALER